MHVDPSIRQWLVTLDLFMLIVWWALVRTLFKRLESRHPKKHDAMGSPTLFFSNNLVTAYMGLRFLVAREHRNLGDPGLSKLSDAMLLFLLVWIVLVALLFVTVEPWL